MPEHDVVAAPRGLDRERLDGPGEERVAEVADDGPELQLPAVFTDDRLQRGVTHGRLSASR